MPFEDYVHRNILWPLGMDESSLLIRDIDRSTLASPHRKNDKGELYVTDVYPYNRAHGPSSTLTSNIEEMAIYLRMYLNEGMHNKRVMLKPKTIQDMWSPALGKFSNIGVCWHLSESHGKKIVAHGGSDVGFKSYILLIPEMDTAAVFMTNSTTPPYREFAARIIEIITENQ